MATTAADLRELHGLHQRAKAIRDRMVSGPKTLATREAILATRQAGLEAARKALKEGKAQVKNKEVQVQSLQGKVEDLLSKRNQVKKQDEYNALTNQIHTDRASISRIEDEVLQAYESNSEGDKALAALEAEVKSLTEDIAKLRADLQAQAEAQKAQLAKLEAAIVEAEAIIPIEQREGYRRMVKQRGADALAAVENGACSNCYVSTTAQMLNELINGHNLVLCNSCGCVLYLAEEEVSATRRIKR